MNITKKQAKQHLKNLSNNWYDDECKYYEIENDCENADSIQTNKLMSSNYKDLRILEDYFNQDDYEEKAKREEIAQSILWEYISKNDIEEIQERLSNV